jgi:fructokinase
MSASTELPLFVSPGDILTDLVRTGDSQWLSRPGGAGWNVARAVARLGLRTACVGSLGTDNFSDELWDASVAAGLDMRFMQRAPACVLLHG